MNPVNGPALLQGLLQRYSPSGQEGEATRYLLEEMKALGFAARIDGMGNVKGVRGEGTQEIVLLGHIDTVRGEIEVRSEGDLLYGRGAVDAKGPLACFVAAAAQVDVPPGYRLTVIGAVGEESDSRGAMYLRERHRPVACIIGEPSRWDHITLGYKGSAWVEYALRRGLVHTAANEESAPEGVIRFWNDLSAAREAFNQGRTRNFDQITASLREIHSAEDGFTQFARMRINVRLPPDLTAAALLEMLETLRGEGVISLLDSVECFRTEKNSVPVRALMRSIRSAGGQPGFVVKSGTSDMNTVGPIWNCPMPAYGPGDSKLDHTPHEHIALSEFTRAVDVLRDAVQDMMV